MDLAARQALRTRARTARRAFVGSLEPPVRRALERRIADRVAEILPPDAVLASYAATGSEVDPAPLDPGCARLCFPRVTGSQALRFHVARRDDLRPGAHGIREPLAEAPEVRPTVVLVPLLLFDASGGRLGQGGGHYDRTLRHLRQSAPLCAIGLAWDMQEAEGLALADWDERLDLVATPSRLIRCTGPGEVAPRPADG